MPGLVSDSPASPSSASSSSGGTRINDVFSAFIQSRYNAPARYLNMDALMEDQAIRQLGINIFQHESAERLGTALCKLMATLCPNVFQFVSPCAYAQKIESDYSLLFLPLRGMTNR